ncbi:MAG: hypothetical protein GFH27_549347n97 [Chloroflexi bacterium AL-W]|nr:hypothetical protein [Chloroflexi bacterium AL-N5]NOK85420.1 hypothetical protein [Chloroflexi bacterium AL-W]
MKSKQRLIIVSLCMLFVALILLANIFQAYTFWIYLLALLTIFSALGLAIYQKDEGNQSVPKVVVISGSFFIGSVIGILASFIFSN